MATATKKRAAVDLLETVHGGDIKVDAEAGVIRGVKILGRESGNRGAGGKPREYSRQAIRQAVKLYEGLPVHYDHPDRKTPGVERSVRDRVGWLSNVRESQDGDIIGDMNYLKSDPSSGKLTEAAERRPELFGLSHNARGAEVVRGGKSIVESIDLVRSVDIVTRPATTSSLFESEDMENQTLKSLVESLDEKAEGRALLLETIGDDDDDVKALKRLGEALHKCKNPEAGAAALVQKATMESLDALESAGMIPKGTKARVKWLAKAEDDAERKELIESWVAEEVAPSGDKKKPAVGTVTKSGGKTELAESKAEAPKDGKEFARAICH
jgi:hypothetical protein